jgi:lipoate-protein ligase A
VIRDGCPDRPAREAALSHALLLRVARRELPATLRLYRPGPTLAFGRLDALRDGYGRATAAARAHGFAPMLRAPGGHAAAYDEGTVGFDLVLPTDRLLTGVHDVFRRTSAALARELAALGADAHVGAVAGEYCPGEYTVNARGRVKLVGTAQRAVRGASLLAGFVTVSGGDRLRAVLVPVYAALELEWDPASLGALADEAPRATFADAERAVLRALAPGAGPGLLDDETHALADELEPRHTVGAYPGNGSGVRSPGT